LFALKLMDLPFHDDLFIDAPQALELLCTRLKGSEWIALDTEFMRERTYYPRLCLLQIATPDLVACVDPSAVHILEPLLEIIYDCRVTKVLHAGYQDLEILYHLRAEPPEPVFDTQIAASLLGFGEQIGYANLVQQMLSVQLPKAHSRSDWCARPLEAAQLRYAADDVRYLTILYPLLRGRLADKGRLGWAGEEFKPLQNAATYRIDIQDAWRRIGGLQTLAPRELNVLRALAAWREREAAARDLPRKWVIADPALLDLARLAPRNQTAMARLRGLQKSQADRYGATIVSTIAEALETPESAWPQPPPRRLLYPAQEATVDMLMALVRSQAALHEVSPAVVATRAVLERLVLGDTDVPLLQGWRAQVAGHMVQKMLAGELQVSVEGGALHVEGSRSATE
jgi:ribonuclease D